MMIEENLEKLEKKVEKQSFAMELLEYSKEQNRQLERANKRLIGVLVFVLILFGITIGAFLYYISTTGYVETDEYSQEIKDIDSVENSSTVNGDIYGENNTDKKEN